MEDMIDSQGRLLDQQPIYDRLLNAEIQMHIRDHPTPGKVVARVVGPGGEQLGMYDNNPYLNKILYQVDFDDGNIPDYGSGEHIIKS